MKILTYLSVMLGEVVIQPTIGFMSSGICSQTKPVFDKSLTNMLPFSAMYSPYTTSNLKALNMV
jgi:hypothetical protein